MIRLVEQPVSARANAMANARATAKNECFIGSITLQI
jgi:hypothetical protein